MAEKHGESAIPYVKTETTPSKFNRVESSKKVESTYKDLTKESDKWGKRGTDEWNKNAMEAWMKKLDLSSEQKKAIQEGLKTPEAIKAFQKENKLNNDGIVGGRTILAFAEAYDKKNEVDKNPFNGFDALPNKRTTVDIKQAGKDLANVGGKVVDAGKKVMEAGKSTVSAIKDKIVSINDKQKGTAAAAQPQKAAENTNSDLDSLYNNFKNWEIDTPGSNYALNDALIGQINDDAMWDKWNNTDKSKFRDLISAIEQEKGQDTDIASDIDKLTMREFMLIREGKYDTILNELNSENAKNGAGKNRNNRDSLLNVINKYSNNSFRFNDPSKKFSSDIIPNETA